MIVKSTAALVGLALAASSAVAQGTAPKCSIDNGGSQELANAYDALGRYNTASSEAEKKKYLTNAVKLLSSAPVTEKTRTARAWILGQTLVAWSLEPNQPTIGPASSFGFPGDSTVDLLVMADEAFDVVEQAQPGCADQVEQLRRLPHIATANMAVEAFNAGQKDSAYALSKRALAIYPKGAVAHQLVGNVAVERKNEAEAIEAFKQAAEHSKDDEQLRPVRENALLSLAYLTQNRAEAATGEEQKRLAMESAGYFREYLQLKPDDTNAASGLARSLSVSGDTAAIAGVYSQMLADPSKYSDVQLIDAGVGAANAGRPEDSIKLLELGLQKNPYYRDALYAITTQYIISEQWDKAVEATNKLLAVDPNNPDYYQLLARAYEGILATAQDNNAKKAAQAGYLKAFESSAKMPVKVNIADFTVVNGERVLRGTVENLTDKPASYVLKVEFLDRAGNVVATKETTVAPPPKGSAEFSVSAAGEGIAAYRYASLTS